MRSLLICLGLAMAVVALCGAAKEGDVRQDSTLRITDIRRAAEKGDAVAQLTLGVLCAEGL